MAIGISSSSPAAVKLIVPVLTTAVFCALAVLLPGKNKPRPPSIHVAFVGNSITFVNDLPRLLERLSDGTISQNSCLHGSLSFTALLKQGNGMYNKWRRKNAVISNNFTNADDDGNVIYDFGACSLPQLLFGYDDNLNNNNVYAQDGKNPCFEDTNYLDYLNKVYYANRYRAPQFDYLIMNDQTRYPGIYRKRCRSLRVLKQVYTEMLLEQHVQPVFYMTHAYPMPNNSTSVLNSIANFTSRTYYGYLQYAQLFKHVLGRPALVAPCGLAWLVLYEEQPELWERLLSADGVHPTAVGTYLNALVLYATLYGHMPEERFVIPKTSSKHFWKQARKMSVGGTSSSSSSSTTIQQDDGSNITTTHSKKPSSYYPSPDDCKVLYRVARRVVLQNHLPRTLLSVTDVAAQEQAELEASGQVYRTSDYYVGN